MSKELVERLKNEGDGVMSRREKTLLAGYIEELEKERDLHRNRLASLLFSDYFKPEVTAGMIQEIADEYIDALAKHDQLREQVKMLREALRDCAYDECGFCINPDAAEALAATEPRSTK